MPGVRRSNYSSVNHRLSNFTHQVPYSITPVSSHPQPRAACVAAPQSRLAPVASQSLWSLAPTSQAKCPAHLRTRQQRAWRRQQHRKKLVSGGTKTTEQEGKKISQRDRAAPHRARSKAQRSIAQHSKGRTVPSPVGFMHARQRVAGRRRSELSEQPKQRPG